MVDRSQLRFFALIQGRDCGDGRTLVWERVYKAIEWLIDLEAVAVPR
jgi:hypothetical protein